MIMLKVRKQYIFTVLHLFLDGYFGSEAAVQVPYQERQLSVLSRHGPVHATRPVRVRKPPFTGCLYFD